MEIQVQGLKERKSVKFSNIKKLIFKMNGSAYQTIKVFTYHLIHLKVM